MKLSHIACAALFTLGMASAASAAEHTVKQGETLRIVSLKTGTSVKKLATMNEIADRRHLTVDQHLTFIDDADIEDAIRWCDKRLGELNPSDPNATHFSYAKRSLQKNKIRYSISEPSGVHFRSILAYAEAWRTHRS